MAKQTINVGTVANDGTGDPIRTAGQKINANFDELYGVTGQTAMIPIMAGGMLGRTNSGAESGSAELPNNLIMLATLDFDPDTDEFAQFMMPMPESWDGGDISAEFIWASDGVSGNCVWGIQGVAVGDSDTLDQAFGSAVTVTDSVTGTGDHMISARTSPFSLGAYADPGNTAIIQVYRDANNGSDTLTADAKLIGIRLYIGLDDYEDS